ncbi:MAG: ABC transporter permease, partial [Notoacmeibacter sp.]
MSDAKQPTKVVSDFEATLNEADVNVASFDKSGESTLVRLRAFLHSYPTAVPIFVLIASVFVFGFTTN